MLLLGHRGAVGAHCPENSLASVDRALRLGADGVEVDVRLTADGLVVCHHDPVLAGTRGTRVADATRRTLPPGVPLLHDVLSLVGHRGRVVVELKPPDGPGSGASLVRAVAEVLRASRCGDVVVSCFDGRTLREARRLELAPTALLGRPMLPLPLLLHRAAQGGHHQAHAHVTSLRAVVEHPSVELVAWTVNRPRDLLRLADSGVVAAICDDPHAARGVLAARLALTA